MTCFEFR